MCGKDCSCRQTGFRARRNAAGTCAQDLETIASPFALEDEAFELDLAANEWESDEWAMEKEDEAFEADLYSELSDEVRRRPRRPVLLRRHAVRRLRAPQRKRAFRRFPGWPFRFPLPRLGAFIVGQSTVERPPATEKPSASERPFDGGPQSYAEPSADGEPSFADDEPLSDDEPSADGEPDTGDEPSPAVATPTDEEAFTGWLGESARGYDPALAAIAERVAARRPMRGSALEFDLQRKPVRRKSTCFKAADIERLRKLYQDNDTAASANRVDRCSCIVMLNVALGQLLKLKTKESRARTESSRKVQMADLPTKSIELAMKKLRQMGFAKPAMKIDFLDRRNRIAGTLKPERLKKSVRLAVLNLSTVKGCWYAYGLSIMHDYHSVLLLVDKTGDEAKIYWLDQFNTDINDRDVTATLDDEITTRTQTWWQAVQDEKHYGSDTYVRLWPLRR